MRVLLVEDEDLAARKLTKLLHSVDSEAEIAGVTDSVESTVEWLESHPAPDLILLDIELADGQSFDIFSRTTVVSPVIFTTSYDEFALRAFKHNTIDYLLKPVQKEELVAALDKFRKTTVQQPTPNINMEALVKELQLRLQPREYRRRFLVKNGQKLVSIETPAIAYFYSDGRVNFFKTRDNKKFIVDYTMDELEELLDPGHFFRIGRAFYVSVESIERIDDYFGNRLILSLRPELDKEALVSREKVQDFKKWMGK